MDDEKGTDRQNEAQKPLGFGQTLISVFWAFFGVRSGRGFNRDAERGDPVTFILGGCLVSVLLLSFAGLLVWLTLLYYGH